MAAEAFKLYDSNSDGKLAGDELQASPALRDSLQRLDADKDGALSLAELTARMDTLASGPKYIGVEVRVVNHGTPIVDAKVTLTPESFMGDGQPKFAGESSVGGYCAIAPEGAALPGMPVGWYRAEITRPDGATKIRGVEVASDTTGNRVVLEM